MPKKLQDYRISLDERYAGIKAIEMLQRFAIHPHDLYGKKYGLKDLVCIMAFTKDLSISYQIKSFL